MLDPRKQSASSPGSSRTNASSRVNFPVLKWLALAWLAIWIPAYWRVWGWQNFLHLCDVAMILSCVGIIFGNRLLVSSQALATLLPGAMWGLDAGWRLFFHHNLIGGTEYLWDGTVPLWVRLLSLFHIVLPIVLAVLCFRIGYDRRALALQSAITFFLMVISRWMGPAALHVAIIFVGAVLLFYEPSHALLRRKLSGR